MSEKRRAIKDDFEIEHVGSSLLNELASGLYQPDTVIREYIQNAIDAHRLWEAETGTGPGGPIQVELRPNGISIMDRGIGMSEVELRTVKSVAVSPKQSRGADIGLTGNKGVGIWAGLNFFEKLSLRTSKRGSKKGYGLELRFAEILRSIDENTHIGAALNPNYDVFEYDDDAESHYTDVVLEHPTQAAEWFFSEEQIAGAIRRICPCEVDNNFVFAEEVASWYEREGFESFNIRVDGRQVLRDYPSSVEGFKTFNFTVNDEIVAKGWSAVSKTRILSPNSGQLVGFRVSLRGFSLNGANPYSDEILPGFDRLSLGKYPRWYVGEIHIVSNELRPNLARDDFEDSEHRRKLVQRIRRWYDELAAECMFLGQKRRRLKVYSNYEKVIAAASESATLGQVEAEQYQELQGIREGLVEDDRIAKESKRGKSAKSAAPIDGRRDKTVRSRRKKLLTAVNEFLDEYGDAITTVETTDDESQKAENARKSEQNGGTSRAASDGSGKSDAADSRETSGEYDYSDIEPGTIHLATAVGLLDEILLEVIPNDSEMRRMIGEMFHRKLQLAIAPEE